MIGLLKQWRLWVLAALLVGPVLAYVAVGSIWLWDRGWLLYAALAWIAAGTLFSILAARWTKSVHAIMPPLDWDSPSTFSPRDREAWKIVQDESDAGESLAMEDLVEPEIYISTGRRLLRKLAEFYHPGAANPFDEVPLIELLTALELAAEDLARLSVQVPGGDLITLSHWRKAMKISGYISRANDLYAVISPLLNPLSGLARLGTRELLMKPAWKNMQQNVLRWFFQAYVNRLGLHLVELMSGRLAIGAERYRRLTRRAAWSSGVPAQLEEPLTAAIVGARGAGKTRLIQTLEQAFAGDPRLIAARFEGLGLDPDLTPRLRAVRWVEAAGYSPAAEGLSRRERSLSQSAVTSAIDCDLLVLVIDGRKGLQPGDVAMAQAWDRHFVEHPQREAPPALVVITNVDHPDFGPGWAPPYDWTTGTGRREASIRALFDSLRSSLPPAFGSFTAAGLASDTPFGVAEHVLPALAALLSRAERSALIRQLHILSGRSTVGRVMGQIGQRGREVWHNLRARNRSKRPAS